MKLLCLLLGHKREYWSREKCNELNVITGVFTPWECKRCGCKSDIFYYPKTPPVKRPEVDYTVHSTHDMRYSMSSRYDDKCFNCGLTDNDDLSKPCKNIPI